MQNKNKWLYMAGNGCSSVGDGLQNIAMAWLIMQLTGSGFALGLMIAITYLPPLLLAPWAGVFSDSRDSKRTVVIVDLVRSLIIGSMVVMLYFDIFSMVFLYLLQGLLAFTNLMFKPASQSLVKETFSESEMVSVLSKASSLNLTSALIGGGMAGWLIAEYSPLLCLAFTSVNYLISAACNSQLQRIDCRVIKKANVEFMEGIKGGWNFLVYKEGMLYLLFLSVISSASLQMANAIMAPYVINYLNGSSYLFTVLEISYGIGGVISGLLVSKALARWKQNVSLITLVGMGVFSFLTGFREWTVLIVLCVFGLGFFTMFHLVTMQTLIQVNTPKEIIGSVAGLRSIIASLTKIVSGLLAGYFVDVIDIHYIFWGFSGIVFLTLLTTRHSRKIPIPESIRM